MIARQFSCTPAGIILRGRRRLRILLLGLTLAMLVVGGWTLGAGRIWPCILALAVALIPWTAWRMSGDMDLFWLELEEGRLAIQMRRRRERFAAAGGSGRRLSPEEIAHLESLATAGGITAGTGGFESHRLGEFDLYASNFANAVLVDLGETRLIVTPDEPQGFLEALRSP